MDKFNLIRRVYRVISHDKALEKAKIKVIYDQIATLIILERIKLNKIKGYLKRLEETK